MANVEDLKREVGACSTFHWGVYNSLVGLLTRDQGQSVAIQLIKSTMRAEQGARYVEGLQKLGIDLAEPPAVKAAKYHYLSNTLGGLSLEYFRESNRKAWIRYRAPVGSSPGSGLAFIPRDVRKAVFMTWHPNNGKLMGCPNLQWVLTKLSCDGHPYDEGFFIERDQEVAPEDRGIMADEDPPVSKFPEEQFPLVDAEQWPLIRRLKAQRNFGHDYYFASLKRISTLVGEVPAEAFVTLAARLTAIQMQAAFATPAQETPERWMATIASYLARDVSSLQVEPAVQFVTPYESGRSGRLPSLAIEVFLNTLCELLGADCRYYMSVGDRYQLSAGKRD